MLAEHSSTNAYDFNDICVALVDDNRYMLRLGTAMLKGLGVGQVLAEGNGKRMLTNGLIEKADILVLDWLLEPISCTALIRQVRDVSTSPNPFIPIIAMRWFTEAKYVMQARDFGATEFLGLPISSRMLYNRIVHVIEHPRPFIEAPGYFGGRRG